MNLIELQMDSAADWPVDFRRINRGRPNAVAGQACYAEWHPDPSDAEIAFDVDAWEESACSFWFTDRESFRIAYAILRGFQKVNVVGIRSLPPGLAIGQIGTGKQLVIGAAPQPRQSRFAPLLTDPARLLGWNQL